MMKPRRPVLSIAVGCALAAAAHADDAGPTLKTIRDTGVVTLGVRESSVPFS
ncbi:amino acid ABC transporter substrate-binding protein, partial [Burkholderia pseudomallei]